MCGRDLRVRSCFAMEAAIGRREASRNTASASSTGQRKFREAQEIGVFKSCSFVHQLINHVEGTKTPKQLAKHILGTRAVHFDAMHLVVVFVQMAIDLPSIAQFLATSDQEIAIRFDVHAGNLHEPLLDHVEQRGQRCIELGRPSARAREGGELFSSKTDDWAQHRL